MGIDLFSSAAQVFVSGIFQGVKELIGEFHLSPEDQGKLSLALAQHELDVYKTISAQEMAQLKVNEAEAANPSVFVSGWRPFVGWVCGIGLAYDVMGRALLNWGLEMVGTYQHVVLPLLPALNTETLMTTLTGMLGIAGLRTYEKLKGVARV